MSELWVLKWIRADEHLPPMKREKAYDDKDEEVYMEISDEVLVYIPEADAVGIGTCERLEGEILWTTFEHGVVKVSHWMPLPEMPD